MRLHGFVERVALIDLNPDPPIGDMVEQCVRKLGSLGWIGAPGAAPSPPASSSTVRRDELCCSLRVVETAMRCVWRPLP